ncbi:MAG: L-histidine N-alpha-methyltransferase [Alphaproteobacteria bacterium]|jgi:L-histidine N-alpha-methyltransferase
MDTTSPLPRFELTRIDQETQDDEGADVVAGLTAPAKSLPCKYFYDAHGSELFDQICDTPEYYPTRTEYAILEASAAEVAKTTGPAELVELGSGAARKTRLLLDAYSVLNANLYFVPIDVSGTMLIDSSRELITHYDDLSIHGIAGTYEQALEALPPTPGRQRLFVFLGSTIGNFDAPQRGRFLGRVFDAMQPGDYFLLGFDRIKDRDVLNAAYNDAQGITAAFNLNILAHLNARFGGDFNLARFNHLAFFNEEKSRIEMHLESQVAQHVRLAALDLDVNFAAGERIHTEISTKFDADKLATELGAIGFARAADWCDERRWFSLMLLARP